MITEENNRWSVDAFSDLNRKPISIPLLVVVAKQILSVIKIKIMRMVSDNQYCGDSISQIDTYLIRFQA